MVDILDIAINTNETLNVGLGENEFNYQGTNDIQKGLEIIKAQIEEMS